jgi:hypothetical protein
MNSSKNMVVAILLLGVSYGVYQIITSPEEKITPETVLTVSEPNGEGTMNGFASMPSNNSAPPMNSQPDSPVTFAAGQPPKTDSATQFGNEFGSANSGAFNRVEPPESRSFDSLTTRPSNSSGFGQEFTTNTPAPPMTEMRPLTSPEGAFAGAASRGDSPSMESPGSAGAFANLAANSPLPSLPTVPLMSVFPNAEQLCYEQHFRDALEILTPYYRVPNLPAEERQLLMEWLDGLAAKVIFSPEHHFSSVPYVVQPGDSLDTLSAKWRVPTNLIFNVNQDKIQNPLVLTPGIELKQLSGPFIAEIDRTTRTATLYVDDMYACRFEMVNLDPNLETGTFLVSKKSRRDAVLGEFVVWLDSGVALYADQGQREAPQSITFRQQDAKDLNEILSPGSQVIVR